MTCPDCERYKKSAAMWRNKAYEASGHPLPWKPDELWQGLTHFDRALLRTTHAPLKELHYDKGADCSVCAEVVTDWEAFFTDIEAKLKEKNT